VRAWGCDSPRRLDCGPLAEGINNVYWPATLTVGRSNRCGR